MKQVVIIGADFTPSSLPPALRIRFFANHLPEFGWQPTILTTDPQAYNWAVDAENERLLSAWVHIIRTGALPVTVARRFGVGDIGMRSMLQHWFAFTALACKQRIDLVFIPVPPYMPMILGRLIHLRYGIPYVIDYIDPWVTDYYWKLPPAQRPPKWPLANALSRLCEPFALRNISHITGVSQGTIDGVVVRYPWLTRHDGTEIPYGGEPADFAYLRQHPRPNVIFDKNDGLIHICSTGRGGRDLFPALRAIFTALRLGLERDKRLFQRLRIHFVGTDYSPTPCEQVRPLACEMAVGDLVSEHPARVAYLDALQILLDAHVLLAVGSEETHYTASKIFPYILAERPLLAVFHEASNVIQTLRETGAGIWVDFGSVHPAETRAEQILLALQDCLVKNTPRRATALSEVFEPFTARAMTKRLVQVFERSLERLQVKS